MVASQAARMSPPSSVPRARGFPAPSSDLPRKAVNLDYIPQSLDAKAILANPDSFPFLQLPLEIRLDIYSYVHTFKGWRSVHVASPTLLSYPEPQPLHGWRTLSLTCRQIRQEFLPFMMDIHYDFGLNIVALARWVKRGYPHLLELVVSVELSIPQDLWHFGASYGSIPPQEADDTIYGGTSRQDDLEFATNWQRRFTSFLDKSEKVDGPGIDFWKIVVPRLQETFLPLSGVRRLKLSSEHDSFKPDHVLILIEIICSSMPNLFSLDISSRWFYMPILRRFPKLKVLLFNATISCQEETLSVLKSRPYLDSITITDPDEDGHPEAALTPAVLAQINPLRQISIFDAEEYPTGEWLHLTVPMIESLYSHMHTLRQLEIFMVGGVASKALLSALLKFVSSSQLTEVDIHLYISHRWRKTDFKAFLPSVSSNRKVVDIDVALEDPLPDRSAFLEIWWESVSILPEFENSYGRFDKREHATIEIESDDSSIEDARTSGNDSADSSEDESEDESEEDSEEDSEEYSEGDSEGDFEDDFY